MRLGLRLFLGFFLIVGLAAFFVMRVFVNEVKPGVRQAMESTLVDAANVLAVMAADDMKAGRIANGDFVRTLGEAQKRALRATVWHFPKRRIDYRITITDARGIVVYDSEGKDLGRDNSRWNDVYKTLRGEYGARSSPEVPGDDTRTVMHVAAPIRDGDQLIGVLTAIGLIVIAVMLAVRTWYARNMRQHPQIMAHLLNQAREHDTHLR